jgi:flavin-dependent dehydrogenase
METTLSYDVAILGGGLAGGTLARQLSRALPGARVALFDRSNETSWKVGESTVEIASNYLTRRLGLSAYLYQRHLPKNGLRFFFDTPERDAPIEAMSEVGSERLPFHPAFQIDRARLEADLHVMNREAGVDVHLGAQVTDLAISSDDAPHRFTVITGAGSREARARWLVDASGRARVAQKALGWPRRHIDLHHASVWGRFRHVNNVDAMGNDAWRGRVRHTSRYISTNHFCYPGYWIWFIPLAEGVVSVGVVAEHGAWRDAWRKPEGFLAFLREHHAVADLFERLTSCVAEGLNKLTIGQMVRDLYSPRRVRPEDAPRASRADA